MKIDINEEIFGAFAFYSAVLVAKMLLMAPLTARQRFAKKVFANPEDAKLKGSKIVYNDPDIERVRRAHLNDMENILPFFTIGFLYCFTNPALGTAKLLFRIFTGARILHTLVYAVTPLPQPSRALAWAAGLVVTIFMTFKVIAHFA